MLEPVDEAAAAEDVAEEDGDEDLPLLPQPVIAVPTTIVAIAQPATVIRPSSMDIPSLSIHAYDGRRSAHQVRRGA
ncbi:MAG TPA: hypothetical protein VMQ38_14700 [Mycobacterium sp.]|nr:hypothetical protein [Mycobacterium sp.]